MYETKDHILSKEKVQRLYIAYRKCMSSHFTKAGTTRNNVLLMGVV